MQCFSDDGMVYHNVSTEDDRSIKMASSFKFNDELCHSSGSVCLLSWPCLPAAKEQASLYPLGEGKRKMCRYQV